MMTCEEFRSHIGPFIRLEVFCPERMEEHSSHCPECAMRLQRAHIDFIAGRMLPDEVERIASQDELWDD